MGSNGRPQRSHSMYTVGDRFIIMLTRAKLPCVMLPSNRRKGLDSAAPRSPSLVGTKHLGGTLSPSAQRDEHGQFARHRRQLTRTAREQGAVFPQAGTRGNGVCLSATGGQSHRPEAVWNDAESRDGRGARRSAHARGVGGEGSLSRGHRRWDRSAGSRLARVPNVGDGAWPGTSRECPSRGRPARRGTTPGTQTRGTARPPRRGT